MTVAPTPPLPPEDADVAAVREEALTWLRGQRSDVGKTEDIINGLLAALQEAERKRDYWNDCARGWHPVDVHLCRAEAAEAREAALREHLRRYEFLTWDATLPNPNRQCPCCGWPEGGHDGPGRYKGNAENTHEDGCSLDRLVRGQLPLPARALAAADPGASE